MSLSLEVVQNLAPDQGSLSAASKLLQPRHWLRTARASGGSVIWGECQGSGANPYRVVADVLDHGYKCTCPSRKFPCKHSLALMWQYVEDAARFAEQDAPDWVQEWLGRSRRGASGAATAAVVAKDKDIAQALTADAAETELSPDDLAKRERSAQRRKAQTEELVRAGLGELQQWLLDQLRGGIAAFVEDVPARCRRIAARLVDAKAATLASRIDELPARLLALPKPQRADAAMLELGQIVLATRAWLADPDDADARAAVVQAATRDALLDDPAALRVASAWDVVGQQIDTRRDGLVSQATWLLDRCQSQPRFALLLDFFPASAGRRSATFAPGQRVHAELVFHPSRAPLRAVLAQGLPDAPADVIVQQADVDPLAVHRARLARVPWTVQTPMLLPAGRLLREPAGQLWWRADAGDHVLRVAPMRHDDLWLGLPLANAVVVWDGMQARTLRVETMFGTAHPDD